jgi:hypothetical protein
MNATEILWGQGLLVSITVLAFVWAAAEWTRGNSASSRGSVGRGSSCSAGRAAGGIATTVVAIAISVWRTQGAKRVETYGSARWAVTREERHAALLGHDGVLLGRLRGEYLRHNGPEHVLCFALTRSGKGVRPCRPDAADLDRLCHRSRHQGRELDADRRLLTNNPPSCSLLAQGYLPIKSLYAGRMET